MVLKVLHRLRGDGVRVWGPRGVPDDPARHGGAGAVLRLRGWGLLRHHRAPLPPSRPRRMVRLWSVRRIAIDTF